MCRGAAVSAPTLRALCREWSRKRGRGGRPDGPGGRSDSDDSDDSSGGGSGGGERPVDGGGSGANGNGSHARAVGASGTTSAAAVAGGGRSGGAQGNGGGADSDARVACHGHPELDSCSRDLSAPSWAMAAPCSDAAARSRRCRQPTTWPLARRRMPSGCSPERARGHSPSLCTTVLPHVRELIRRFGNVAPAAEYVARCSPAPQPSRAWPLLLLAASTLCPRMHSPSSSLAAVDCGAWGSAQAQSGGACGASTPGVHSSCAYAAVSCGAGVLGAGETGRYMCPSHLQRGLQVAGGGAMRGATRHRLPAVGPSVKARPRPSRMGPALMML